VVEISSVVAPHWAETVGWIFLALGFASAALIVIDEFVLGHRQQMWIMNLVHPITALYWGPVWLWAYFRNGRTSSKKVMHAEAQRLAAEGADPDALREAGKSTDDEHLRRWHVANADSHCGAGCTLGDIAGEWIVYALGPLMIAGATVWPEIIIDFPLAWAFGIVFQYFTIVPMRDDVGKLKGLWLAIRADTLSIVSFQVGLFAWMIISAKLLWQPPLHINTSAHWWMMQVGMILGFFTAYPVNRWLVKKGWKEKMDHRTHLAEMVEKLERSGPEDADAPTAREKAAAEGAGQRQLSERHTAQAAGVGRDEVPSLRKRPPR
jgi:hypothetical protein